MALPTITALPTAPSRANTPTTFNTLADAWVGALSNLRTELNAYAAALPATITGTDFTGTSSTSTTIGTGPKSFTASTGRNWQIGQGVRVAYTTTPTNYMDGQVTAYNSTTGALTVNVTSVGGAGTQAAWTISPTVAAGSVTLTGAETLTNKTLTTPVLSGTASGTTAGAIGYNGGALSFGDGSAQRTVATLNGSQTFTNKTIDTAGTNVLKVNGNTLAASAGTATITLPNSTDTLVGRATTDTMTNKTLTAPAINGATLDAATTVSDTGTIATNSVGFRGAPASSNATGTFALTDNGKMVIASGNWTVPANASIAFPIGATIPFFNNTASTVQIAITTDTMRQAGTTNTGTRTVAAYGLATLLKVASTTWVIAGNVT